MYQTKNIIRNISWHAKAFFTTNPKMQLYFVIEVWIYCSQVNLVQQKRKWICLLQRWEMNVEAMEHLLASSDPMLTTISGIHMFAIGTVKELELQKNCVCHWTFPTHKELDYGRISSRPSLSNSDTIDILLYISVS